MKKTTSKSIPISIRITKDMQDSIELLAKIYRLESPDMYRLAVGEMIIKNLDLLKNYENRFEFIKIDKAEWYKTSDNKFVKWTEGKFGVITGLLIECFSDGWVTELSTTIPIDLEKIITIIDNAEQDFKLNKQGIIYLNDEFGEGLESKIESEKLIIETLCVKNGMEKKRRHFKNSEQLNEYLESEYGIYDKIEI